MESLPLVRRAYYGYLSRMYELMHTLSRRTFLGFRLSTLARWLPIVALLVGLARDWPVALLAALLALIAWINYSLWRAKRDNYNRFVPLPAALMSADNLEPLAPNTKVPVLATGLFSVSGRSAWLLLSPAHYWRVPLGEHVIMAEETPGKYLYQFFGAASLQDVRAGLLLFGRRPVEALAVSFLAQWGPEYTRFGQVYETGHNDDLPPPKRVIVYLTIGDADTRRAVWHTIVSEARRARVGA